MTDDLNRGVQRQPLPQAPAPGTTSAAGAGGADDPRLASAIAQLRSILVPGEVLQAVAVQRRLFALTHRRILVAATSGRFIALSRGLFGGFTPTDLRWQDLQDVKIHVGIFGAEIRITSFVREDLASAERAAWSAVFPGLQKEEAEQVYRYAQAQEQAWREKRRVRDLDELRARSGGIQVGQGAGQPATTDDDPVVRLRRAKEMLQDGLITDAEFESIKAKLVDRL
jgi:hypothetical protein